MMGEMRLDPQTAKIIQELSYILRDKGMSLLGLVVGFPDDTGGIERVALSLNPHLTKDAQDAVMDGIWAAYHGPVQ